MRKAMRILGISLVFLPIVGLFAVVAYQNLHAAIIALGFVAVFLGCGIGGVWLIYKAEES